MYRLLVAVLLSFTLTAHAQNFTEGEGSFLAEQSDNLNFVKRQLLASAFRDVVRKELTQMGLDADSFFSKLDEKYNERYAEDFQKLKTQYGQDGDKPDLKRKEDYLKAKRVRELNTRDRFENLNKLITSYSTQNITRSSRNPQMRFMKIQARVDRQGLNGLYLEHTRTTGEGGRKLYISVDFDMSGLTFLDYDIQSEEQFKDAILKHWKGQIASRSSGLFEEIKIADESDLYKMREHVKNPLALAFADGHWLNIRFKLKRVSEDKELDKREIRVEGGMVLVDLSNGLPLSSSDFTAEQHVYRLENATSLGLSLTNLVARMPQEKLATIVTGIPRASQPNYIETIIVKGNFNILDINKIVDTLNNKGLRFEMKSRMTSLSAEESRIDIQAKGEREQIQMILNGLKGMDISNNKRLDYSIDGGIVVTRLSTMAPENAPDSSVKEEEMPAEAI